MARSHHIAAEKACSISYTSSQSRAEAAEVRCIALQSEPDTNALQGPPDKPCNFKLKHMHEQGELI